MINIPKNNKKTQLTIFIVLAFIICFLMIFFITRNFDDTKEDLEEDKVKINSEDNSKLFILKTNVDYCLDKQLKRAVITSGLKGGFIYTNNEYYLGSVIPINTYTEKFISNLDLDWNNLQSKVLVHSQASIYTPGIVENEATAGYSHNITADMEKFITVEFLKCLDLENYTDIYDINYTDYLGDVKNIDFDENQLRIKSIDAEIGDTIDVYIKNETLNGTVVNITIGLDFVDYLVNFTNLDYLRNINPELLYNLSIVNRNKSLNLSVKFNSEDIVATIHYPIQVRNNEFATSYEGSTIVLPVRYKELLKLSKQLMINKSLANNRDIDFLAKDAGGKLVILMGELASSNYFGKTQWQDIEIRQLKHIDETEHKQYVYSLIDNNSLILGNPFVFNFAYENIAPIINFADLDDDFWIAEDNKLITIITSQNHEIEYNLSEAVDEMQFNDYYIFYFDEVHYDGSDGKFDLSKNGIMKFTGYKEKIYTFNIRVTDGETSREHIIKFITGFPDNEDNKAVLDCIEFRNREDLDGYFPIASDLKDDNAVYHYIDATGLHHFFALSQYIDTTVDPYTGVSIENSMLFFSKSCLYDENNYHLKATISYGGTTYVQDLAFYESLDRKLGIEIPMVDEPVEVIMEVVDNNHLISMVDPFNVTIYPATCLGPRGTSAAFSTSCCDMNKIDDTINDAVNFQDETKLNDLMPTLLLNGIEVLHQEMYLCLMTEDNPDLGYSMFDYEEEVIWDEVDSKITSLFKSEMVVKCRGEFPGMTPNIETVTAAPPNPFGVITGTLINSMYGASLVTPPVPVPISLGIEMLGSKCEFCYLDNMTEFQLMAEIGGETLAFSTGLVPDNAAATVTYLLGPSDFFVWGSLEPDVQDMFNDARVLCNDNWFGSDDDIMDNLVWQIINPDYGKDPLLRTTSYASKGYCYQGSTACSGRPNNINHEQIVDTTCGDKFFQIIDGVLTEQIQTSSISCGSYDTYKCVCNGGPFEEEVIDVTIDLGCADTSSCSLPPVLLPIDPPCDTIPCP